MKALVTGSAGFVGRHTVKYLKELGWDVYGLDVAEDPEEDAFLYFVDQVDEYFDLVVHCAYEVGGRAHIDGTNMALAHNVSMDAAMFDWALRTYQGAVLYFSSSAAYPVSYQYAGSQCLLQEDLIDIDSPEVPDANYGWAKLTGEKIAKAASNNGLRVHVVRPFSGYGSDQSTQYPFPSIIRRAIQGDLTVWGPQGQTRDWVHIDDVVRGAFAIYEADERRPVNLCTGIPTEMGELMKLARFVYSEDCPYDPLAVTEVTYLEDKPTGVHYRVGDPTLMNEYYTATITLDEGVREAINYGKAT